MCPSDHLLFRKVRIHKCSNRLTPVKVMPNYSFMLCCFIYIFVLPIFQTKKKICIVSYLITTQLYIKKTWILLNCITISFVLFFLYFYKFPFTSSAYCDYFVLVLAFSQLSRAIQLSAYTQ